MVGDLGNITADNTGRAFGTIHSKLVKLRGKEEFTVLHRSVIVFSDPDDLGKGVGDKSKVDGNAGIAQAMGEIKLVE